MKGVIGRFFFQFGITLSVAVLLSYFEAITLAPARCAQILTTSREGRSRIGRAVDDAFVKLEHVYHRALAVCLARPWTVLLAAVLLLAGSMATVPFIKTEFIPSQDQSLLNVRIQTETGTSIAAAKPLIDRAEQILAKRPEVARVLSTLQGTSGSMTLTLVPPKERSLSAQALSAESAQAALEDRRHPRVGPGSVAAGLRRLQGLPGRLHRARPRLGHARRPAR